MTSPRRHRLVLASASPRRLDLMTQVGIVPDVVIRPQCDETPHKGELPRTYVERMIQDKMAVVADGHQDAYILTADTVVVSGRRILLKAESRAEAESFLRHLSGRRHQVITGVCLSSPSGKVSKKLVTTTIQMKRLTEAELSWYLDQDEWRDKAGAYSIQGLAARYISFIQGSYTGVVGLPLHETYQLLSGNGFFD